MIRTVLLIRRPPAFPPKIRGGGIFLSCQPFRAVKRLLLVYQADLRSRQISGFGSSQYGTTPGATLNNVLRTITLPFRENERGGYPLPFILVNSSNNADSPPIPIDVPPAKAEVLARPHSGSEGQQKGTLVGNATQS